MIFENRLAPDAFEDDGEVGIILHQPDTTKPTEKFIPERLFHRAVHLGKGYELHNLSRLDTLMMFDSVQAAGLLEEVEFAASLMVGDPALMSALAILSEVATTCVRSNGRVHVEIDLP